MKWLFFVVNVEFGLTSAAGNAIHNATPAFAALFRGFFATLCKLIDLFAALVDHGIDLFTCFSAARGDVVASESATTIRSVVKSSSDILARKPIVKNGIRKFRDQ